MKCKKSKLIFWSLFILLLATVFISATVGSVRIGLVDFFKIVANKLNIGDFEIDNMQSLIMLKVRLPRLIVGMLTGMGLALVGAVYQGFFRNPMADPYILGLSSGAAFGATLAIVLGLDLVLTGVGLIPVFAFAGALATSLIVYMIASSGFRRQKVTLLLAGIAISYFLSSLISLIMVLNRDSVDKIVFWTMGGLSGANWQHVWILLPTLLVAGGGLMLYARDLNILALGDDTARSIGVDVEGLNLPIMALSSLIVAVCVSFTGVIGFVGLVVPHVIRILSGPDHRTLMPLSLLGGGLFLVLSDSLARTIAAPAEIPVGAITSLIGSPYFIWLLIKHRRDN